MVIELEFCHEIEELQGNFWGQFSMTNNLQDELEIKYIQKVTLILLDFDLLDERF